MNIPQGYKQTELGIIPEDWEVVLLGSGLRFQTGYPFQSSYFNGDGMGVRLIRNRDLKSDDSITHYSGAIYNEFIVNNYDILIGMDGDFMPCVWDKGVALLNQRVGRLVVKNDWSPRFLYYALQEPLKQKEQGTGATTVKHLSHSDIERILMSIPPSKEQRAIAEALSDVDGLIAALDKKIAKKRLLKQGTMQQLLTGKKRLPGFTDEWIEKKLGNVGSLLNGYAFKSETYSQAGKYKVITIANVQNGRLDTNDCNKVSTIPSDIQKHQILKEGNILISMTGNVGRACLVTTIDCLLNQRAGLFAIRDNSQCDESFIYTIINSKEFETAMIDSGQGAAQSNIGKNDIEGYTFLLPNDTKEQLAIATILSDMDKEIADLEAQRDKYRLLKSGMMQKLLTGQIRLVKQQAKIVPLGVEAPVVREIPVATHIIAGHIVNRSHQSRGWGRTKLQKSLHLIGYCTQLNLGNEYIRNTAGPDDQQLMNYIDQKFRRYRHVNKVSEKLPDGRTHYSYTPTPMIQDVEMAYEKYPQKLREQVDALIDRLNTMDLAGAEILSTLYAVWNNRIIKREQITDDLLIADFYAWSTHKADFEESRVRKALNYMRDNNIIPVGWGKYIDQR